MRVVAKANNLKISSRKVRQVTALLRGQTVIRAEATLLHTPQAASVAVAKALKSAVANAENNHHLRKANLLVDEVRVDEGPTLKRFRARAMGRAGAINKRSSHLTIIVTDQAS